MQRYVEECRSNCFVPHNGISKSELCSDNENTLNFYNFSFKTFRPYLINPMKIAKTANAIIAQCDASAR